MACEILLQVRMNTSCSMTLRAFNMTSLHFCFYLLIYSIKSMFSWSFLLAIQISATAHLAHHLARPYHDCKAIYQSSSLKG